MKLQVVGCNHHGASVAVREKLAFNPSQVRHALESWHASHPDAEAVLLSTCNRVELYTACEQFDSAPSHEAVVDFLAGFHHIPSFEVFDDLFERTGEDAVRHLFTVAASLDSMVVGEPQILSQVKQAYKIASDVESTGPLTHSIFQAALKVARRVATETTIHQRRVSIPSVAVADFAKGIFERFSDKQVLVVGAGEMGKETLTYLKDEGATKIDVVNRRQERAEETAAKFGGRALPWSELNRALVRADVVISTTAASEPILSLNAYQDLVEPDRRQRPLFILDLAIPRDFDPAIGDCQGVYLYSIDDLRETCRENLRQRDQELPIALRVVEEETERFMVELHHRSTGPIIKRLREGWQGPKEQELKRLLNKLPDLDEKSREEIEQSFDRLINKLLHPPLESLRDESRHGPPHGLLDALKRLFQIRD